MVASRNTGLERAQAVDGASASAPSRRTMPWLTIAVFALVLTPLVVSAVMLLGGTGSHFHPTSDQALAELRLRHLLADPPLLGPYSRFGFAHPGAGYYYLLAVPYWLTGGSSASYLFAPLVLNAGAAAGILVVARRRGGSALLVLTGVVLAILTSSLGVQFLRDAWNPYVTVLPFLAFVFLAWSASCGDRWAIPWATFAGSFVVQSHVGYALPAVVVAAVALGGLAWTEWRDPTPDAVAGAPRWSVIAIVTTAVLVVVWLPTLVEQLTHDPGNLQLMYDFFSSHGQERSAADGWHVIALQLGAWPDWVRGETAVNILGEVDFARAAPLPITGLLLVLATAWAWRRSSRTALRLDLLAIALVVASFVAATRVVDFLFAYLVRWTWAVGALVWIAIAWTVVEAVRPRVERDAPRVAGGAIAVGMAAIAVLGFANVTDAVTAGTPEPSTSARIGRFTDAVETALDEQPGTGAVEMRMFGASDTFLAGADSMWTGAGITDLLDQRGHEVVVAPELEFAYGDTWTRERDDRVRMIVMPVATVDLPKFVDRTGWTEVASGADMHIFVRPASTR